ncbi:hypothetical protein AB6A40_000499 [Gnathostoma spinigerum]|uniref:CWH43-like N-terminal domain-containing protein n=1 Tax=Gnathostoma spinigerum TaxID=75299 RepID=A0ABD6E284_9BILA
MEPSVFNQKSVRSVYAVVDPFERDGKKITEVLRLSPVTVFFIGFIPPVLGAIGSICVALIFHNDQISNYNWQCGRARLPSLSRIINLKIERILWEFFILIHVPVRIVELFVGYVRYRRLKSVQCRNKTFYEFCRHVYFYIGMAELIFLAGLSVIGERERISVHVILFYIFGGCGVAFFIANIVCHANSLYYLSPYGRISYYVKIVITAIYVLSIPVLFGAFLLYWKLCITVAYDIFAICEYIGVFLNVFYHGCAFFDIRYKVFFCVRHVKDIQFKGRSTMPHLQL